VTEDEIVASIRDGATTLDAVRDACDANTGCGGCTEDVEELLRDVLAAPTAASHCAPRPPLVDQEYRL
jgi:NAD(P)H-nitrite reductase large subunit